MSIGVLLVFAIVFTAFMPSFASSTGIENMPSLKETDRNSYYGFVFESLIDSFPTELIQDELGEREEITYPQEYAGAYIDEFNILHIVLTKEANAAIKNNYHEIMGNDEDIIYDTADFPLSSLYEIQRKLDGVMQDYRIESTALNEITNKLEIHLLDNTKEKEIIEFLKNEFNDFDARSIIFKSPIGIELSATDSSSNALAGSDSDSDVMGATLGFNAYRHSTGNYGVVTAAHFATSGTTIENAVGTTIGSASIRQYSGTIDAAFVPFPVGISWSYKISGIAAPDDCITHYYPDDEFIVTGLTTDKRGRTTGGTSGTVTSVSTSLYVDPDTFTDLVRVSNTQQAGDSGGPVYHSIERVGQTDFRILVGIATFMDANNNGYVSKVENIMDNLGITPKYGE